MKANTQKLVPVLGLLGLATVTNASAAVTALPTDAQGAFTDAAAMVGFAGVAGIAIAIAWVLGRIVIRAIKGFGK
jgi:hypothetical protein